MDNKTRKIAFYSISKKMWANNAEGLKGEYPFIEIKDLITHISKLKSSEKNHELRGNKTCSLMSATVDKDNPNIITGVFKSAQYSYRPDLWDIKTDIERPSPKKLSEGDKEKTHFAIKITEDEVFLVLEINGNGITIGNIISYFTRFNKSHLQSIGKKQSYSIKDMKVCRGDFLQVLQRLNKSQIVEVHMNKSLLGGAGLRFSNRTQSVRKNIVLTLKAERGESITEVGIDVFNFFNGQKVKDSISKVRIYGKDEDKSQSILDTSFMEKMEFANLSLNPTTGEVQTPEILTFLKSYLADL